MSGHGNAYIQTNNPTMGLNPLLYNNILQSNYFKNYCCDMTDYPMVVKGGREAGWKPQEV